MNTKSINDQSLVVENPVNIINNKTKENGKRVIEGLNDQFSKKSNRVNTTLATSTKGEAKKTNVRFINVKTNGKEPLNAGLFIDNPRFVQETIVHNFNLKEQEIQQLQKEQKKLIESYERKLQESQIENKNLLGHIKDISNEYNSLANDLYETTQSELKSKALSSFNSEQIVELGDRIEELQNQNDNSQIDRDYVFAQFKNMETESRRLNIEIENLQAELELAREENYSGFSRTVSATLSIGGGLLAGYMIYNNPEMLVEVLYGINNDIVQEYVLPYAKEIVTAAGGIAGYAIASYLGAPVLYSGMKVIEAIDYVFKSFLSGCVRLSVNFVVGVLETMRDIMQGIVSLITSAYHYRGTVCLLAIAAVLAYYNPESAAELLYEAYKNAGIALNHLHAYGSALCGHIAYVATEHGLPALSSLMNGGIYYGSQVLNGLNYGAIEYGIPMLSSLKNGGIHYGSQALNGLHYGATEYGLPAMKSLGNGGIYYGSKALESLSYGVTDYVMPGIDNCLNAVIYHGSYYGNAAMKAVLGK
ncbi:MAG: hypothetical protein C5B43_00685 [Verrucomicrobia bacterium]|nr:MAG: hypothetical protein C5B43_00685 [Verrucomicrobiota bacterium]